MRSVLRQRILKPKDVAIFSGDINQVIADLIKRIYILKSQAEDGETVTNVNDLFFKYSMEGEVKSGVGRMEEWILVRNSSSSSLSVSREPGVLLMLLSVPAEPGATSGKPKTCPYC